MTRKAAAGWAGKLASAWSLAVTAAACAPVSPLATGASGGAAAPTPTSPAPTAAPVAAPARERVAFAVSARSLSFLPQLMAQSLGYYEREGLDVNVVTMRSDLQVAGMLSGELDYSAVGGDPVALAVAEGAPIRTILISFDSTHFTLVGQKGMARAQLKGARIGASRLQSVSHLIGRAMVGHLGFSPDADVTFFSTGETSTSFAALEAGNIDAAVLSPPFSSELVSQGYADLAHASDLAERVPFTGITTSTDHLRAKPEQAVRAVRAVLEALGVLARDKPQVLDLLVREWEIDPPAAAAVYDEVVAPIRVEGRMSDAGLREYLDRILAEGLIRTPLMPGDITDFSYLERAAGNR